MENGKAVLEVSALTKSYGDKKVLKNVSFTINEGEIVGFLGPNGAGKSTTMNIITGYLSPSSGSVTVCGTDILEDPKTAKANIGYLPELPPLYFDMTVGEYLDFVYELKKCKLNKKEHINECMKLVKISNVAGRMIKNLSKGYKQRVGFAQALIGNPKVLILDEPTVGLDPAQIMEIRDVIRMISKTKTVILSTHILQEVTAVCDKIIIINNGKIMACDYLENLESGKTDTYMLKCRTTDAENIISDCGLKFRKSVSGENGIFAYIVEVDKGNDVRAELFTAFANAGIPLLELYKTTKSIEAVFREYTENAVTSKSKTGREKK